MSPTEVPCDARLVDGLVRGAMVGALWAGFFGPSDLHAEVLRRLPGPPPHTGAFAARHFATATLGFAALNGAYNGLFCGGERLFGGGTSGAFVAGAASGAAIGVLMPGLPPPRGANVAMCAISTAVLCAGCHRLVNGARDGVR